MVAMKGKLPTPVEWRYEVRNGCEVTRVPRTATAALYGCPAREESPEAYIWPEASNRYVVAIKSETQSRGANPRRAIGCYHVFPTLDAAGMFALAAGGR